MGNRQGKFITFEGIEGAGKSTAILMAQTFCEEKGMAYVLTREPGGTEVAELIRHVVLDHHHEAVCVDTEILLYFAARAQHLAQVIKPALAQGKIVLCDRFTDATFAYQSGGREIPEARIATLETWVQGDLRPDVTILMDVPVELGMMRAKNRGELDRIESEDFAFFERVRQGYLDRAKRYVNQYRVVDASVPMEAMNDAVLQLLVEVLLQGGALG